MSLLSGLDNHERNPCNKWGRYSTLTTTVSDHDPGNDEVCLLTLSPPVQPTRKTSLQNLRQRKPQTIEIEDDKNQTQLRSNIDRNPKDFYSKTSSFTIPKTKSQTAREKSLPAKKSCADNHGEVVGKWLQTGNSSTGNKKIVTQIQLVPDSQGRPKKRASTNGCNKQVKLRRQWFYAETPRSSDDQKNCTSRSDPGATRVSPPARDMKCEVDRAGRFSRRFRKADTSLMRNNLQVHIVDVLNNGSKNHKEGEKSPGSSTEGKEISSHPETPRSRYAEEIRCPLCNDVIWEPGGCLTCPKTSDDEYPEVPNNSDELSEDGFLVPVKRTEPPGVGLISSQEDRETEVNRTEKDENKTKTRTLEKQTAFLGEVDVGIAPKLPENDFNTETSEVPKSNIRQDDMFCVLCGDATTIAGCGCSKNNVEHKPDKFYPRSKRHLPNSHCGRKCGGVSQIATKRKRAWPTAKMKNAKEKKLEANETSRDSPGETKVPNRPKTTGRRRKNIPPKEPVCVHISSDEEETPETTGNVATNNSDDVDASSKNKTNDETITYRSAKEGCTSDKIENGGEKPTDLSADESEMTKKEDGSSGLASQKSGVLTKRSDKRQKKSRAKVSMCHGEENSIFVMAKWVLVGSLSGDVTEPVEIRDDRIIIKISHRDENLEFKLEKNNVASFKIHSECTPLVIFLTPTPGWARKYIERYRQHGIFIDPGSRALVEKQIMLLLSDKIVGESLAALTKMIATNLSDDPIVERMGTEEAEIEFHRIVSAWNEKFQHDSSSSSQSTNSSTVVNDKIVKTYSTRSKSCETASVLKVSPKKILVYQPSSKSDAVTITSEDMLCLNPSTYLNDTIIDFFLKYLIEEKLTANDKERIHVFSTFFYEKLTQRNTNSDEPCTPNTMHRMVKSWTKNVDIFSKDFLVIPINENAHWYLVIICFPNMVAELAKNDGRKSCDESMSIETSQEASEQQNSEKNKESDSDDEDFDRTLSKTVKEGKKRTAKRRKSRGSESPIKARPCILIFDSLGSKRRMSVQSNLRNYLNCEWKERKNSDIEHLFDKDTLKGCHPKVPCQENYSDCGLYVLQYFESFFTNPIEDYKFPINLRSWFSTNDMSTKREHITQLIYELQAKAESNNTR